MRQPRRKRAAGVSNTGDRLEALLVLDRMMVEVSMRLYNLPRRERRRLLGHTQRLHRLARQEQKTALEIPNQGLQSQPRRRSRRLATPGV